MGKHEPVSFESAGKEDVTCLSDVDIGNRVDRLGARGSGEDLVLPFYGVDHRVMSTGVADMTGRPANPAVSAVVLNYILRCPATLPVDGPWITFREFSGAGPLMGYFADNTHKLLENTFAENGEGLQKACPQLGAMAVDAPGYDISMEFSVFPRVPVRFRFNLKDAEFPAQCSLLFRKSAEIYLDMKSMAIAGTWLAGNLVGFQGVGNREHPDTMQVGRP